MQLLCNNMRLHLISKKISGFETGFSGRSFGKIFHSNRGCDVSPFFFLSPTVVNTEKINIYDSVTMSYCHDSNNRSKKPFSKRFIGFYRDNLVVRSFGRVAQ